MGQYHSSKEEDPMQEPDIIRDRLKHLQDARGVSIREIHEALKINRWTLRKLFSGNIQSTRDKALLRALIEFLGSTEDQFFGVQPTEAVKRPQVSTQPIPVAQPTGDVPLYGEIPAGHPNMREGFPEPDEWIERAPGLGKRRVFALRVQGMSMAPHLLPGDIVYLEPLELHLGPLDPERPAPRLMFERLNGRIVAALLDGETTLKVLAVTPKTHPHYDLHLVPLNEKFEPLYITPSSEVRFQGVVVKIVRDELTPHTVSLKKGA
jgi:SOS-response transcriptional repressor LexA